MKLAEAPEESPKKLLLRLEETLRRMETLTAAIYRTNDLVTVEGRTLTRWIYTRDTLFFRLELYKNLIRLAGNTETGSPESLDVSELQAKAERMKVRIRSLYDLIEKTSWAKDLVE